MAMEAARAVDTSAPISWRTFSFSQLDITMMELKITKLWADCKTLLWYGLVNIYGIVET